MSLRTFALLIALGALAGEAAAQPVVQSRYTRIEHRRCVELPSDDGGDHVAYRCPGQPDAPVWLHYVDSTRLHVGFGRRRNTTGIFSADRNAGWPIEWRGRLVRGQFVPYAAIARLRDSPEPGAPTVLAVWKLTGDGASCLIGRAEAGPRQNAAARQIADQVLGERNVPCQTRPDLD
jgi:hypothetical protein